MFQKLTLFLSYTHKDETYKNELQKHLMVFVRNQKINLWSDRDLIAGDRLNDVVIGKLNVSDIVISIISADYIASDYCYNTELKIAIEKSEKNECVFIPVIARACQWKDTCLKDILVLPRDGKPISKFKDRDDAYYEIVDNVRKLI